MRLLAWSRRTSKTGGDKPKIRSVERFDCNRCARDEPRRAALGCTRVDLPTITWRLEPPKFAAEGWMGRLPIIADDARAEFGARRINPEKPPELPAEGCPAGWYRSRFVASIHAYLRRRDSNGGRVPNLLLDRCDDDVLIALAQYTEDEQERAEGDRAEVLYG